MEQSDTDIIHKWLNDPSFLNWANEKKGEAFDYWESWFIQHPAYRELGEIAREMITGLPFRPITAGANDSQHLDDLWKRIEQTSAELQSSSVSGNSRKRISGFYRIAAVVVLLLLMGISFYAIRYQWGKVTLRTGYEETAIYTLEDGSRVVLNANSELTYDRFRSREVYLDGEAYFEVEKKPAKDAKFHVITPDLTIEVLGTEFNVKRRKHQTEVYLKEGEINLRLENYHSSLKLKPGDYVAYSAMDSSRFVFKQEAPAQIPISWKDGVTLLESVPLYQVLNEIEAIYGIHIELESDSLKDHILTVALPVEDMEIGLQTLEHALNLKVRKVGARYHLGERIE